MYVLLEQVTRDCANNRTGSIFLTAGRTSEPLPSSAAVGKTRSSDVGFTMIELLVVLAIIALIVGMGTPAFLRFNAGLRLKASARQVVQMLQIARSQAITHRITCSVVVDLAQRRVSVVDEAGQELQSPLVLPEAIKFAKPGESDGSGVGFEHGKATFLRTGGLKGQTTTMWLSDTQGGSQQITVYASTGRVVME